MVVARRRARPCPRGPGLHAPNVQGMTSEDPRTPSTGAEGEASKDSKVPFEPKPDDPTPLGDTDQHSKVDHDDDPGARVPDTSPSDD